MSAGFNNISLVGRITHDLDLKKSKDGKYWIRFNIAVNSGKEEVDFIDVVAFNEQAENLVKYQSKGSKVLVNGRIKISSYQHKDHEIQMKSVDVVANNIIYLESAKEKAEDVKDEDVPYHL